MIAALPYALGGPPLRGVLRACAEDFFVDEDLGFAADGAGEHVLLRVEKRGANTAWIARELARFAGVPAAAVSFAGLKDRHAVARQWFSVHLAGTQEPDWTAFETAEARVLEAARHRRKLRRGAHAGNRFTLRVREVRGDRDAAVARIERIAATGVPNYFGEQRFGRGRANVAQASAMFAAAASAGKRRIPREERSLLLSAARAQLFNAVLAERVARGNWNRPLEGEVWMLAGSHSIFGPEPLTPELATRCADGDIVPTGPLWGSGALRSTATVAALETAVAQAHAPLAAGLAASGLRQERRALVLRARELVADWCGAAELRLSFYLESGCYATVLIRELVDTAAPGSAALPD